MGYSFGTCFGIMILLNSRFSIGGLLFWGSLPFVMEYAFGRIGGVCFFYLILNKA